MQNLIHKKPLLHKTYRFLNRIFTKSANYDHLYSAVDDIYELTADSFDQMVLKDNSTWLVQFYSPWCAHCKAFTPEYKKVANRLKGIIKVGAVNAPEFKTLANRYKIRAYPTLTFFAQNKLTPINYTGKRVADHIVQAGMHGIHNMN